MVAPIRATSALLPLLVSCVLASPATAAPPTAASATTVSSSDVSGTAALAVAVEPEGVWPLRPPPEVVRGFDPPAVRWGAGHRGVDLAGHLGQSVHAALAGTVSYAGRVAGRGVVVVDHGETKTTYQPVSALVSVGDVVERGQRIGRLAFFGSHCLPRSCLHWGLIRGVSTYLDPLELVGGPRPVRLLPVDGGTSLGREPTVWSPVRVVAALPRAVGTGATQPHLRGLGWAGAAAPPPAALALVALGIAAVPHHLGPVGGSGHGPAAGPAAGSGPGVGLEVGGSEPLGAHVGVELGGRR